MKKWPGRVILTIIGCCLVVVGLIPLADCLWLEFAPRPEPFFVKFPLRKGEYTSSPFTTGFRGPCKIDLESDVSIIGDNLGWKIVDEKGRIVAKSPYDSDTAAYWGIGQGYRKGQRIVVTLPHDLQGVNGSAQLKISVDADEIGLDMSYASGFAIIWAGIVAGPSVVILLVLMILKFVRRAGSDTPSRTPETP